MSSPSPGPLRLVVETPMQRFKGGLHVHKRLIQRRRDQHADSFVVMKVCCFTRGHKIASRSTHAQCVGGNNAGS
eukprot:scaffold737_cov254-Pinguiococcus_pyrenoidosus.AAC.1